MQRALWLIYPKAAPAIVAEAAQGLDVSFEDLAGLGERRHRSGYARLAQQVQHRIGRAVAVVLDVLRLGAGELVVRMEARDLDLALQPLSGEGGVGQFQKIVVVEEIAEHARMHQQRG